MYGDDVPALVVLIFDDADSRKTDGDTFEAMVDLGFYTYTRQNFRLLNYDAPETRGVERPIGLIAKKKLEELLEPGTELMLRSEKSDRHCRWVAEVRWGEGTLAQHLIDLGYGKLWPEGEKRVPFDPTEPYPLTKKEGLDVQK